MNDEMNHGMITLSLRRSKVRQRVLAYLVVIHPSQSYPAEIARKKNLRRNEVYEALNGTRERYRKESSLVYLGLVEKEEYSDMCMYKSTEKGKKIWEGRILRNDLHGVYGSEITINGAERVINDVKFSEDGEYIVIKADNTELICMTKEGEILWQHHFDQIVDVLSFGDAVIVYNGFSYSEILVITANGEKSWRWNLGKDRYEIG